MSKLARTAACASAVLGVCATIIVLCGLAAVQNLCHTSGPITTNSRRLLQLDLSTLPADLSAELGATCSKAFRFQWWGWALQVTFLGLVGAYTLAKAKLHAGILTIGGTSTLLAMIFANDVLKANDALGGKAFSRNTLLFVGWILVAVFNYLLFIASGHTACDAGCCGTAEKTAVTTADAAKPPAATAGDVEVAATTAGAL
ncbi:hypothetical protein ABPG75_005739 [Micractinium tetrahymenae]